MSLFGSCLAAQDLTYMRFQEREPTSCPYQQCVSAVICADPLWKLIGHGDADHSGVMVSPKDQVTVQNYDMQFGTNVIGNVPVLFGSVGALNWFSPCVGPWLFTKLLLPALFAATDASSTHEKARIVTVSSSAGYLTNGIDFDAIADGPARLKYGEWELYNKSKFVRKNQITPQSAYLKATYVPG